jgi:hypothetical protein
MNWTERRTCVAQGILCNSRLTSPSALSTADQAVAVDGEAVVVFKVELLFWGTSLTIGGTGLAARCDPILALKKHGIVTSARFTPASLTGGRTVTNAARTREIGGPRAMTKLALLLLAIGPMIVLPAIAQTPGAAERTRVAGTVEELDGDRLTVNEAGDPEAHCNAVSRCDDL